MGGRHAFTWTTQVQFVPSLETDLAVTSCGSGLVCRTLLGVRMIHRLIFLDMDGVLNSGRWMQSDGYPMRSPLYTVGHVDPAAIAALSRIIELTDASIVVSSSAWNAEQVWSVLKARGRVDLSLRIIGETATSWTGHDHHMRRGLNIQKWINGNPEISKRFVIIDDSSDMGHLRPWWVQTTWNEGLTETEADECVRRLTRKQ